MSLNRKLFSKSASDAVCNSESLEPFGEEASFNKNVAIYQFEDNVNDSSGNGNNGTAYGATYVTGKFGKAASFDGTNDYIDTNYTLPAVSTISFSLWFKTSSTAYRHCIFSDFDASGNNNSARFSLFVNASNNFEVIFGNGSTDDTWNSISASSYLDGNWHHAVLTGDGTALKLYVDGSLIGTDTFGVAVGTAGAQSMVLGRIGDYSGGYWNGLLDQLRIYTKTLSAEEVTTLYVDETTSTASSTTIIPGTSCLAYYPLDYDASDKSTNYDGTPSNVEFVQNGKINYSALFNGSNSAITSSGAGTALNVASFSASLWFKATSVPTTGYGMLLSSYDESGNARFYFALHDSGLEIVIYGSSVTWTQEYASTVSANTWYHLVVTHTGTTTTTYLNGSSISSSGTSGSATAIRIASSPQALTFGQLQGYSGTYPYSGLMDEVRIFNKALSASEVTTLYGLTACTQTCTTDTAGSPATTKAYYTLDSNVEDSSGNSYDGTATDITYAGGRFGSAASFNGSSSKILLPSDVGTIFQNNWSCSLWLQIDSLSTYRIVTGFWKSSTAYRWGLEFDQSDNKLKFFFYTGGASAVRSVSTTTLSVGTWYHVAVTVSSTAGKKIFINGNLEHTLADTDNLTTDSTTGATYENWIGRSVWSGGDWWDGLIDQVKYFPSVLTDSQMQDLYDKEFQCYITKDATDPFGDSSEKAFYKFEDNVNDSTGSFDGSVTGSITYSSTNPAFGSKSASGFSTSNYINIPAITDVIDNAASDDFTFSIWFRLNAIPASSSNFYTICGIHNADVSGSNGQMWEVNLFGTSTSNEIEVRTRRGHGGNVYDPSSYGLTKVVAADTWYNLVCAYTGSTKVNQIYINGSLLGSNTLNSAASRTIGNGFNLGTYSNDGSSHSAYAFNGLLDQCRIFNTTLTGEKVWKLYAERNN